MRFWTTERQISWAKRYAKKVDAVYFNGFFKDKELTFIPYKRYKTTWASAHPITMSIRYNPLIFEKCSMEEIKDTFIHEMLHLFLFAQKPYGEDWDDDSAMFREWSRRLKCPRTGLVEIDIEENTKKDIIFRTCIDCDLTYTMEPEDIRRSKECPDCGSSNTKFYRRKKI